MLVYDEGTYMRHCSPLKMTSHMCMFFVIVVPRNTSARLLFVSYKKLTGTN